MLTYNGCYVTFDEKERGTLEKGKIADMVILSDNPYKVKPQNLRQLKVEKLILSGEEYKPQNQSLASVIWKGISNNQKY
jgi:predicted amidohydrolase YtcJ